MPNSPIPDYADAKKIFNLEGEVIGSMKLAKLVDFTSNLVDSQGLVQVQLKFLVDDNRRRIIRGTLRTAVKVACQRCLEPIELDLAEDIELVVVFSEEKAMAMAKEVDIWVCLDEKIDLVRLIAEQLSLSMPIVNYHQQGDCYERIGYQADKSNASDSESPKFTPFAVLQSLKKD